VPPDSWEAALGSLYKNLRVPAGALLHWVLHRASALYRIGSTIPALSTPLHEMYSRQKTPRPRSAHKFSVTEILLRKPWRGDSI
jgi:hypothetical protein